MMSELTLVPVLFVKVPKSVLALRVKEVPEIIVKSPVVVEYVVVTSPSVSRTANSSAL